MTITTSVLMDLLTRIVDSEEIPAAIRCDAQKILREFQRGTSPISEEKAHAYGACNEATCLYCKAAR